MIHVGKNLQKAVAYIAILTSILSGAAFVYAQFSEGDYLVKTVHIFPSQIEAKGWNNASTLSFQNLGEYALLQEFNSINSATMNLSTGVSIELDRQTKKAADEQAASTQEEAGVEATGDTPEAVDEVIADVATDTQSNTESETAASTSTTNATSTEVEFDVVLDDNVPAETAQTQVNSSTESEPESAQPEPDAEEQTVDSDTASTTVMKRAQSMFRLAMTAVTSVFDSATNTAPTESTSQSTAPTPSESTATTTAATTTQTQTDEEETTTTESPVEQNPTASSTPVESAATSTLQEATSTPETGVVEDGSIGDSVEPAPEATTTVETEEVPEEDVLSGSDSTSDFESATPCTEDCKPYVITLADFGFPLEDETEVTGAQLRMSFAAQKKSHRERIPMFEMRYSMDDGVTWSSGGAVVVDDEVSNGFNGGYFLFALPEVADETVLDSLQVELSYRDDPTILKDLFVESVWLELFTVESSPDQMLTQDFAKTLLEDGYKTDQLSGDTLQLPNGKVIDFDFTDENENETLIIKSNKKDYVGLTKTTTYFSVTNEGARADDFTLQTYFPRSIGEVKSIKEYSQNTPKKVVIPEYRPFVYHCEAGWEFAGEVAAGSIEELSQQLTEKEKSSSSAMQEPDSDLSTDAGSTTSETLSPELSEEAVGSSTTEAVEFDLSLPQQSDEEPSIVPATNTTTTVFQRLPSVARLLQSATTTPIASSTVQAENDGEAVVSSYMCRNTNVVRECDSIEGDNTACRVENKKVAEHAVTQFAPGWTPVEVASGTMPKGSIFKRVAEFVGFGPDKKAISEGFEVRSHSNNQYTIQPGETKYFEMEISFPPFSSGEYWIEAIGDREYGLLDPFWSSQWRYRMPIEIDNLSGAAFTEQQVFVEFDYTN